jgi:hypothetical protein
MQSLWVKIMSIDTWLNLVVFAFIGVMLWLYFKDVKDDSAEESH